MVHEHDHAHASTNYDRAFAVGLTLNAAFVVVELVCGLLAGSLALVADAGHNLSDVLALLMAWGAAALSHRLPTVRRTYGLRRSTILAALGNAVALLFVVGGITWEAVRRLSDPQPVDGLMVMAVAAFGVVINGISAGMFLSGRKGDMNVRAAFLHMASDAVVSLGVVLAGFVILATGQVWLDPVVSIAIGIVVLIATWSLLRDSFNLAVDAVPNAIDPEAVQEYLSSREGVLGVHDLHIWGMSTTETALTAHLVVADQSLANALLMEVSAGLDERFEIEHATIQIEIADAAFACGLEAPQSI